MDIPEESNAKIAMRQKIQAVMRDTSLSPQEKQQRIQQIMAGGQSEQVSAAPPAARNPKPSPGPAPAPAPAPAPTPAVERQSQPSTGSNSSREQIQAIMRNASLTPQEKQTRIQQVMASGGPSQASGDQSQASGSPPQSAEPKSQPSAQGASSREQIQAVMRNSSLTPQEKQARIQQIMASSNTPPTSDIIEEKSHSARAASSTPSAPAPSPAPAPPSQPSAEAQSSREQIQAIMRDSSLTPQEKQARIQQFMASGGSSQSSGASTRKQEPDAQRGAQATAGLPEKSPAPAPPSQPSTEAPSSREQIQAVMRNSALTPQEKQARIQQIMASSNTPPTTDIVEEKTHSTRAASSTPSEPAPAPAKAPPSQTSATAPSSRERIQAIMRDSSLSPQEKQKRIQQIMASSNTPPTTDIVDEKPKSVRAAPPKPSEPVPAPAPPQAPSSREQIQAIMRDSSLTPQEKQARIQQIMASSNTPPTTDIVEEKPARVASSSASQDPESETKKQSEPPAPSQEPISTAAATSRQAIQEIMQDSSIPPQEKQRRIQEVMASGGKSPPVESTASKPEVAAASKPEPVSSVARGSVKTDSAALSQVEQDALAKARIRAERQTSQMTPGAQVAHEAPSSARSAQVGDDSTTVSEPEFAAVASQQTAASLRRSGQSDSRVGAVASTGADIASRKNARQSGRAARNAAAQGRRSAQASADDGSNAASSRASGAMGGEQAVSRPATISESTGAVSGMGDDSTSRKSLRNSSSAPPNVASLDRDDAAQNGASSKMGSTSATAAVGLSGENGMAESSKVQQSEGQSTSAPVVPSQPQAASTTPNNRQSRDGPELVADSSVSQMNVESRQPTQDHGSGEQGEVAAVSSTPHVGQLDAQAEGDEIQAFVVEEDIQAAGVAAVLSEAEEEEAHRQKQKRTIRRGACLLIIVIIAVIVPTILKTGPGEEIVIQLNNSEAPSSAPSSSPTTSRFAEVSDMVKLWYEDDEMYLEVFGDDDSSQFKAAEWVANDDPLQLDMSDPRLLNRYVLATFYFATIGDEWLRCGRQSTDCELESDWLSSSNECNWFMIMCEEDTITEFRLPPRTEQESAGFAGTLPFDVALLSGLHSLLLTGEDIGGSIPESWSRLQSLENFWLGDNSLTGTFPEFLVMGTKLEQLDIWGNMLEGPLPTSLSSDTLKVLSFYNNSLNGTLSPGLFSGLPALTYVDLELNNLEGVIPTEIYSLVNLGTLYLGQNAFEGVLTDDIANLSKLKELGLSRTQLSGSLPSGLFDITSLKTLTLSKANFTGQLPETFSNLESLRELYLNDNRFSGPIPMAFDAMTSLNQIQLHGNDLTGSVSDTLCERKGPRFFDIHNLTVDCDEIICPASCCDNCNA